MAKKRGKVPGSGANKRPSSPLPQAGDPKKYGVLSPTTNDIGPPLRGPGGRGTMDWTCSACNRVLVFGWPISPEKGVVGYIRCPWCNAISDLEPINQELVAKGL
jgi:hypothetical protein